MEAACGELLDDLLRVGFGLVDLVDGDDDRHVGGAGVIDGLEGLRHDAVVCCDDDDDDVGDLGSAGTHAGEGFVAGGVEEDDLATEGGGVGLGDFDLVGADVLGDASGFAAGDVGGADGVEERGFAVVDVAHDGDDGRADDFDHAGGVFEEAFDGFVLELLFDGDDLSVGSELAGDVFDELGVEGLVDGDEDALHEKGGDEIFAADVEFFGEVLDADAFGDRDGLGDRERLTRDRRAAETWWRLEALHRAFFGLLVALIASATCRDAGWDADRWVRRLQEEEACRRVLRRDGHRSLGVHRSRDEHRRGRSRGVLGRLGRWDRRGRCGLGAWGGVRRELWVGRWGVSRRRREIAGVGARRWGGRAEGLRGLRAERCRWGAGRSAA